MVRRGLHLSRRRTATATGSRSLLLPVLAVVLSLAYEARSFSHSAINTNTRLRRLLPRNSRCWATLEHPSMAALTSEEDGDNNNNSNNNNGMVNNTDQTLNHPQHPHQQQYNNHNRHQWHGRKKKAKKNINPAMADTAFLRKRTEKLLALPATTTLAHGEPAISSRGMKVDRKTFHFLIDAWAFSGEIDAAQQAIALLHKMEELYQGQQAQQQQPTATTNNIISIQPDVRSFTKVINAVSRTASPRSGEMAEEILDKMVDLYESGKNLKVKPNTFTYTAVVEAHANSNVPGSAQSAHHICELMVHKFVNEQDADVRPTARSYNAVINAYAKSGDFGAAQRADDLFHSMEGVYQSTGLEEVKPNAYNYNSLISAWANCREEGAAQRAEQVLGRMETLYKGGDVEVKPTTVTYNAVMDAYSKCAGQQEENDEYAGERAEKLLHHMESLYEAGENVDAKPNVRSYNTVINVWAKSRSEEGAMRAEAILDLMEKLVEDGDKSVQPDVHSYSTVINAWARSQKENKAERALNLLKEMKRDDNNMRPNVVVANAVMNACAYTTGGVPERNRAMEIAHKVFKSLEAGEYGKPDQVTYGTFLQVCVNQMPECSTRDQIVEMIFQKCCKDGQVGNLVLQQLKYTTSPQKYLELVGVDVESFHGMEDLPKDWWCNVVEGKWRRRRNN